MTCYAEHRVAFSGFNLDFDGLNDKLNTVKKQTGLRRAISSRSLTGETRTFAEILDLEVEKIVLFYLKEQGNISGKAWHLRSKQINSLQDHTVSLQMIENLCDRYRELGSEVLCLLEYLDDNVFRLRKIIRRHDLLFDQKMGSVYFDTRLGKNSRNAQLLPLYSQEGIQAIISTIRKGFEDLYEAKDALEDTKICNENTYMNPYGGLTGITRERRGSKNIPRISFGNRLASFSNLQDALSSSGKTSSLRKEANYKSTGSLMNLINRVRSLSLGSNDNGECRVKRSTSDLEPLLKQISIAAERVMQTQKQSIVEYLASTSKMALEYSIIDDIILPHSEDSINDGLNTFGETKSGTSSTTERTFFTSSANIGLNINLLITFIYLANQYVVAPSSAEYARMLGMTPAMSGVIIGLAPAAALVSSLFYSMWSNYSFKQPILTCILCGVFGNIAYAIALQCNASWLMMFGRLLTGFGGPRVVTRRYIADHVPLKDRLFASSMFVTAGALGLACGPLIASLVSSSGVSFVWYVAIPNWIVTSSNSSNINDAMMITVMQYQAETAPGWIMAIFWMIALIVVVLLFEEPDQKYMRCNITQQCHAVVSKLDPTSMDSNVVTSHHHHNNNNVSSPHLLQHYHIHDSAAAAASYGAVLGNNNNNSSHKYGSYYNKKDMSHNADNESSNVLLSFSDNNNSNKTATTPSSSSSMYYQPSIGNNTSNSSSSSHYWPSLTLKNLSIAPVMSDNNSSSEVANKLYSIEEGEESMISPTPGGSHANSAKYSTTGSIDGHSSKIELVVVSEANSSKKSRHSNRSNNINSSIDDPSSKIELGAVSEANSSKKSRHSNRANNINNTSNHDYLLNNSSFNSTINNNNNMSYGSYNAPHEYNSGDAHSSSSSMLSTLQQKNHHLNQYNSKSSSSSSFFDYITIEVVFVLFVYFVNKVGQELTASSIPLITREIFGWSAEQSGYYMAAMGAVVLPMNIILINSSSSSSSALLERDMLLRLTYLSLFSTLIICHFNILGPYTILQYVMGSAVLFAILNCLEGVIMSLLAQVISPELARGTFNSGLLATEAGTFGRVIGDIAITAFGTAHDSTVLVNNLFFPFIVSTVILIFLTHYFFDRLM